MDYGWYIIDGELVNIYAPPLPAAPMLRPYPARLWRIDPDVNGGYPYNELLPGIVKLTPSGAFMDAHALEHVYIPRSCLKIGEYAFANTALRKVKIPAGCEYFDTSFPPDCEVEFYGGGGDYGQLLDGDGFAVVGGDGARIYIEG